MPTRGELIDRFRFMAFFLAVSILALALLHACQSASLDDIEPAGTTYFPLSVGNTWVFTSSRSLPDSTTLVTKDTLQIDESVVAGGKRFYRLRWSSWSGTQTGTWVYRDEAGNVHWSDSPQAHSHDFLVFDAKVGATWNTGRDGCLDSLRMWDDYAVVETPYGRFDGVQVIGDVARCSDFGWGVSTARGIGPVRWVQITIAGQIDWLLSEAHVRDDAAPHILAEKPRITNTNH